MPAADTHCTVYLTADVARLIERTPATVRAETQRRRLRASLLTPGGVHVYTADDVAAYIAARQERAA